MSEMCDSLRRSLLYKEGRDVICLMLSRDNAFDFIMFSGDSFFWLGECIFVTPYSSPDRRNCHTFQMCIIVPFLIRVSVSVITPNILGSAFFRHYLSHLRHKPVIHFRCCMKSRYIVLFMSLLLQILSRRLI
jgi:hypothetical protein